MIRRCLLLLALAVACSAPLMASEQARYAGAKSCSTCHEAIVAGWSTTPHAKAFESLKKSSQENLPGCVKCHVTGFEKPTGFVDIELTPELAGVQCEQCHGPAKAHVESGGDPMGLVRSSGASMCTGCHTPGQDKNFNYSQKVRFVHASEAAQQKTAATTSAAKLLVEPMSKNFGTIDEGVNATMIAKVTNLGDKELTITNVRTN